MARILVVDDERDVVTLIKFLLEKDGHRVSAAYNGREAMEQLGIEPKAARAKGELPELIVLDVMMPEVDGLTLCLRLVKEDGFKRIPVLVLTAKGQLRDQFEAAGNVASYLEKPFDPKTLRDIISHILRPAE